MADMERKKKDKVRFMTDRRSFWVQTAVILMICSAVFRAIGGIPFLTAGDSWLIATQYILPLACSALFVLLLEVFGGIALWTTSLAVLAGVAFFILKAFDFESLLHTVLCILLYVLVLVLYCATVFGILRTKWLLVPLFALPFVYHIAVEDRVALLEGTMDLFAGLQELSVLFIMLSLLCTAFAMKKKPAKPDFEEMGLPPIKDPVVRPFGAKPPAEPLPPVEEIKRMEEAGHEED